MRTAKLATRTFCGPYPPSIGAAVDEAVAAHYSPARLREKVLIGIERLGKTTATVLSSDLKTMDEFHMGGLRSSMRFLQSMRLSDGDRVLDVGCGIGGFLRTIATNFEASSIDGVDLSPSYIALGSEINGWPLIRKAFLGAAPVLRVGSALALPYADSSFTKVCMLHVGMNIQDKPRLFRELARVCKPGGSVGIYDIMRLRDGDLTWPLPWSSRVDTSFVARRDVYRDGLAAHGLTLEAESDRSEVVLADLTKHSAMLKDGKLQPSPLELGILLGESPAEKGKNIAALVRSAVLAPVELVFRKE